jgi:hypothetical protein
MLLKLENTTKNGSFGTRYINTDKILFIEKFNTDESIIYFDVSSGERDKLVAIYTKLTLEELSEIINNHIAAKK